MVQGFIVDWGQGGARRVLNWVEGSGKASGTARKLRRRSRWQCENFRCSQCGFLESFARPELEAG
jgi:hypothetical protein